MMLVWGEAPAAAAAAVVLAALLLLARAGGGRDRVGAVLLLLPGVWLVLVGVVPSGGLPAGGEQQNGNPELSHMNWMELADNFRAHPDVPQQGRSASWCKLHPCITDTHLV
jgi:hypothetical protein